MTLSADYRRRAQNWINAVDRLPADERAAAMEIAQGWLKVASDALVLEQSTPAQQNAPNWHNPSRPLASLLEADGEQPRRNNLC